MKRLRNEVLQFPQPDGGLDLIDLLFERLVRLSPVEAAALRAGEAGLCARDDLSLLWEGPMGDSMRAAVWASRVKGTPSPATVEPVLPVEVDWEEARALPWVAAEWREPERWRRLHEERRAGRRYLMLPGLLAPSEARRLMDASSALEWGRLDTGLIHGGRRCLASDELVEWQSFMGAPATRRILGGVLGVVLPAGLVINAWRLERGDHFGVHPDGRQYKGTLSLGLTEAWTAGDGGAIAFGDPTAEGFIARDRWLPHLGDACLFAPDRTTFHVVEPVLGTRSRLSVTGWWA